MVFIVIFAISTIQVATLRKLIMTKRSLTSTATTAKVIAPLRLPATGIEPVLYCYNRILSPARLPVPPRRHEMDGGGFEPPKQFAADLQSVPFGHSGIHPYVEDNLLSSTNNYFITSEIQMQFFLMKFPNFDLPAMI